MSPLILDTNNTNQTSCIEISVVIPVFNSWHSLSGCLESLFAQIKPPSFEVIVIDDGSDQHPPEKLIERARLHKVIWRRQEHCGVSVARNFGIRCSRGGIILFVDADCFLDAGCLRILGVSVLAHGSSDFFQLRICGRRDNLVGKAEDLHQSTIQNCLLLPDGKIRWLNTSGFAIRMDSTVPNKNLFDERAVRLQDTLLLSVLIEKNTLPVFVSHAKVYHCPSLTVLQYIGKGMRTSYHEERTYSIIDSKGIQVRSNYLKRFFILYKMWDESSEKTIGRHAFFVVLTRFILKMFGYWFCRLRRI
jgi:glycosyltransferase involved in cell wall biosynthesis